MSSAGNTRGLIEAAARRRGEPACAASSAGNTRGLIEASPRRRVRSSWGSLPRGIPAASLKPFRGVTELDDALVFRGEYPRPH